MFIQAKKKKLAGETNLQTYLAAFFFLRKTKNSQVFFSRRLGDLIYSHPVDRKQTFSLVLPQIYNIVYYSIVVTDQVYVEEVPVDRHRERCVY